MLKYKILLSLFFISLSTQAEHIFFQDYDEINENIDKSHFLFTLDTTLMPYQTTHNFQGSYKSFVPDNSVSYIGPGLNFGWQLKLFGGLATTTQLGIFYYQKTNHDLQKASEEYPLELLRSKEYHRMYGTEISQALSYRFSIGSLFLEPFIAIGVGVSQANSRVEYFYNNYLKNGSTYEYYREDYTATIKESIAFQNIAFGFNLLSTAGIYSFLKVKKNTFTIGESETEGSSSSYAKIENLNTVTINQKKNIEKSRDEYSLSLGIGYIF